MIFVPKMRLFNFVTAFVLLMASAANSAKVTPAKARSMFRKAMEYSQFDEGINKNKIMKDMLSKATFVKGRKLAEGNQDEGWDDFGFDVSQYSVKYSGCSVIQTYSDEMAEDETTDTVLVGKKFVIFRLCPSQSCNKYTVTGCTEDYGEYLIEIGDYLEAVSNFYQEKSKRFCEYCLPCYQNGQSSGGDGAGDNGGRRHLADVADEADAGDAGDAADEADAAENGNAAAEETCDDTVCTDSYSLCYKADGDEAMDVHDFMNCAAVEYNNVEYYLAPHCSSDGFTVKLGVYSDDECSTFVKSMSVDTVLGFSLDSTIFSTYFPKTCTSCLESVSKWFWLMSISLIINFSVQLFRVSRIINSTMAKETPMTGIRSASCVRIYTRTAQNATGISRPIQANLISPATKSNRKILCATILRLFFQERTMKLELLSLTQTGTSTFPTGRMPPNT